MNSQKHYRNRTHIDDGEYSKYQLPQYSWHIYPYHQNKNSMINLTINYLNVFIIS